MIKMLGKLIKGAINSAWVAIVAAGGQIIGSVILDNIRYNLNSRKDRKALKKQGIEIYSVELDPKTKKTRVTMVKDGKVIFSGKFIEDELEEA